MRREQGSALIGIIIIVIILLVGGVYFWNSNKRDIEERKAAQEQALLEASLYQDAGQASVIGSGQ